VKLARGVAGIGPVAAPALLAAGGLRGQDGDRTGKEPGRRSVDLRPPRGWDRLDRAAAQRADLWRLDAESRSKAEPLHEELRKLWAELARKRAALLTDEQKKKLVDIVTADVPKPTSGETGKTAPAEEEQPEAEDPDQ
jgi:hypothetical protein